MTTHANAPRAPRSSEENHLRLPKVVVLRLHEYGLQLEALALARLGRVVKVRHGLVLHLLMTCDKRAPMPERESERDLVDLMREIVAREKEARAS